MKFLLLSYFVVFIVVFEQFHQNVIIISIEAAITLKKY